MTLILDSDRIEISKNQGRTLVLSMQIKNYIEQANLHD